MLAWLRELLGWVEHDAVCSLDAIGGQIVIAEWLVIRPLGTGKRVAAWGYDDVITWAAVVA